jgi:dipeptidase
MRFMERNSILTILLFPAIFFILLHFINSDPVARNPKGFTLYNLDYERPIGCTTILVGKDATADNSVIVGHNEDMGTLSGRLLFQPKKTNQEKDIKVNYSTIPQVPHTYEYWAAGNSKPVAEKHYDGGWILCGMNEFGVSIGCNTMSTREDRIPRGTGIMRYEIRKLILERSKTSRDAVSLVGKLIDMYSQCDSPVAYCISDQNEAWVVETTYRHWVAKRIPDDGYHVIANQYTIETEWDIASDDLVGYAIEKGWYAPEEGSFNFKYIYGDQKNLDREINTSREFQGKFMLNNKVGSITVRDVLSVLSLPPIQTDGTQAYMIWHLRKNIPVEIGCVMWFGMCGANTGAAVPVYMGSSHSPEEYREASMEEDSTSAWWKFKRLQKLIYPRWWEYSDKYLDVRKKLNQFQKNVYKEQLKVEKKVLESWNLGNRDEAKKLLSNFTSEKLATLLDEVRAILTSFSPT